MTGNSSVGFTLSMSVGAPATYDAAGFGAKVYTKILDVESIPDFGGSAQINSFVPLETGDTDKSKGSINYGSFSSPIRRRIEDAGQIMALACFDGENRRSTVSLRFTHPEGGTIYCTAIVSGFVYSIADANAWTRNSISFEIKGRPVPVADVWTVNFVAGSNGSIVGLATQIVADGGNSAAVYAAPAAGYVFEKWSDEDTDNPRTLTDVQASVTLTASFVVDE